MVVQDPIGKSGSFVANSQSPTDRTSITADGEAAIDSISHVGASSSHPPYIDGSPKALSNKALSVILENDESVNASHSFKLAPLRRGYTQHNLTDETSGAGVDAPMKATHNGATAVRPSTTIGYVKRNTDADELVDRHNRRDAGATERPWTPCGANSSKIDPIRYPPRIERQFRRSQYPNLFPSNWEVVDGEHRWDLTEHLETIHGRGYKAARVAR